jgi:hypothetical protein
MMCQMNEGRMQAPSRKLEMYDKSNGSNPFTFDSNAGMLAENQSYYHLRM